MRTVVKLVTGTDQRGFKNAPIHLIVAISDKGKIRRFDGWEEPQKPFRVFVAKADAVPDKIDQELAHHRKGAGVLGNPLSDYGAWSMEEQEAAGVAEFLAASHVDRSGAPPSRQKRGSTNQSSNQYRRSSRGKPTRMAEAVCKDCGARDLTAERKWGYFWRCGACGETTAMPKTCPACGAEGRRSDVHKKGTNYFLDCNTCGTSETIWTEA